MYFGFFVFDFISVKHFGQPWLYIRCSINKSDLDLDLVEWITSHAMSGRALGGTYTQRMMACVNSRGT